MDKKEANLLELVRFSEGMFFRFDYCWQIGLSRADQKDERFKAGLRLIVL